MRNGTMLLNQKLKTVRQVKPIIFSCVKIVRLNKRPDRMTDELIIDDMYHGAFNAVKKSVEEEIGFSTVSPHPSVRIFICETGSITVQLGEGLSFYIGEEEFSKSKFMEKVPESEADYLMACANIWQAIGQQQMENLSEEYLEKYQ